LAREVAARVTVDIEFLLISGDLDTSLVIPLVSFSRGMVFTARAIDRVERPSAANKMIRERKTSRCSVVGARTRASSAARSSGVSRTSAAWESS
jgi:hypothetical protein